MGIGGVFWNFGFGLRKKVGILNFWEGGYSGTLDLDLGEKIGNLDFWDGGVFWNFGFGLRKKVGNLDFSDGGGYSGKVTEKKKKNLLYRKIDLINLE